MHANMCLSINVAAEESEKQLMVIEYPVGNTIFLIQQEIHRPIDKSIHVNCPSLVRLTHINTTIWGKQAFKEFNLLRLSSSRNQAYCFTVFTTHPSVNVAF